MDVDAPFGPMRFRSREFEAELDRGRLLQGVAPLLPTRYSPLRVYTREASVSAR
jgi:hypothetical protein